MQCERPVSFAKKPSWHCEHDGVPWALYVPAGHGVEAAFVLQSRPASHTRHVGAAVVFV